MECSIEDSLQKLWAEVLGNTNIHPTDSLIALGADSMAIQQALFKLEDIFGIRLLFRDIFDNPTIQEQAAMFK